MDSSTYGDMTAFFFSKVDPLWTWVSVLFATESVCLFLCLRVCLRVGKRPLRHCILISSNIRFIAVGINR